MMTDVESQGIDLDTKRLSEFIYALNIARRQILSYPSGHPMVAAATNKLVTIVPHLLEFRSEVTLGIARDSLLIEGEVLDAEDPVFRDLAKNLFDLRIASLTVNRALTEDDVCSFFALVSKTPDQQVDAGCFNHLLESSGCLGIRAQGIDFSAFSTTEIDAVKAPKTQVLESDTALLWKSFANGIVMGSIDPDGERYRPTEDIDPVLLAAAMNREHGGTESSKEKSYEAVITAFINGTEQSRSQGRVHQESLGRLGDMVSNLNPQVRRQFLNSMFKACTQTPDCAENILSKIPQDALLDALEQMDHGAIHIPQTLMDVLGKLSSERGADETQNRVAGETKRSAQDTAEQLTTLFSEDRSEYFVPGDYQDALSIMASAQPDQVIDESLRIELVSSLAVNKLEEQYNAVLLDLLGRGVDPQTSEAIARNMDELVDFFLETGDFTSLASIYLELHRYVTALSWQNLDSTHKLLDRFVSKDFADKVLDGFDLWDKRVHSSIQDLIKSVGVPFAMPLLERLADEPSMSRRRLFMQCLVRIGPQVKDPIAAQLHHKSWFFVRNMVVILREINDPGVIPLLSRVAGNSHPKVQYEVMYTYLQYGDERANRFLLKELSDKNSASLLNAVRLAAKSRDPRVVRLLVKLLNAKLPTEQEEEIKNAVIKALHESATEDVLPELSKFLMGKRLFSGSKTTPQKIKVVALLEMIATVDAGILAGKVAQSASGDLARVAEEVLVRIHGKLT